MSFVATSSMGAVVDVAAFRKKKTTTAATAVGDLLSETGDGVTRSTSSDTVSGATRFDSIAMSIQAASDTEVLVVKLVDGMVLQATCTNNTNDNQVGSRVAVTDHTAINNTTTDLTTNVAPFEIVAIIGATTDKKALVRYVGGTAQTAA